MTTEKKSTEGSNNKSKVTRSKNIIIGIGVLLLVSSNAWASAIILMGTTGMENRILVAPMVIFVGGTLIWAFTRSFTSTNK